MNGKSILGILIENEKFQCGMLFGPDKETVLGNGWSGCIWVETCPCDCRSKILILGESRDRQVVSMSCNHSLALEQLEDIIPYIKLNAHGHPKIVRVQSFGFKKHFIQQKLWFKL